MDLVWKVIMDKIKYRTIQRAWQKFDRLTALGCAQKDVPFDPIKCREVWDQYNRVLASYDILPFPSNYHG